MYRHVKDYEIRYTDVDAYDNLKLSSLLSFLQESACLSADELGFGYKDVAPKNIGFIIANWYIELFCPVKLGDKLSVHTWPVKPKSLIFLRDFELYCNNKKVGVCSSRWCMINTDNFSLLPMSAFFENGFFEEYNTERSVDGVMWKIPEIPQGNGNVAYSKVVRYSDYDHYFHVNNTKYADFLMDVFSVDFLADKSINKAQISYSKQCKEGELIDFIMAQSDDSYIIEGRCSGELRVQFKVQFNEI